MKSGRGRGREDGFVEPVLQRREVGAGFDLSALLRGDGESAALEDAAESRARSGDATLFDAALDPASDAALDAALFRTLGDLLTGCRVHLEHDLGDVALALHHFRILGLREAAHQLFTKVRGHG